MLIRGESVEIRSVTRDDVAAILDVYRQCKDFLALGPEPKASMPMVTRDLLVSQRQGGTFCGVFDTDDRMIGVVDFVTSGFEDDHRIAYLSLLMLAVSHRDRGLGAEIVELVEMEVMTDTRVTTILSSVQVNNPEALRFWQMNGYRVVGGPETRPDQTTVLHLQKDI